MENKSSLVPFIVAGSLVVGSVLLIALVLLLAGFLSAPLNLMGTVVLVSLGVLGVSIGAAVLSRRP